MAKPTVYLDSTVPSFYHDDRESIRYLCETTRRWWDAESRFYDVCLSVETLAELGRGEYSQKADVLEFAGKITVLAPAPEIGDISAVYLEHHLMPEEEGGDAVHLAYASFYRVDFLLTWNCRHLANANKKRHIRIMNTRMNLFTPEITTPLELFMEE